MADWPASFACQSSQQTKRFQVVNKKMITSTQFGASREAGYRFLDQIDQPGADWKTHTLAQSGFLSNL